MTTTSNHDLLTRAASLASEARSLIDEVLDRLNDFDTSDYSSDEQETHDGRVSALEEVSLTLEGVEEVANIFPAESEPTAEELEDEEESEDEEEEAE